MKKAQHYVEEIKLAMAARATMTVMLHINLNSAYFCVRACRKDTFVGPQDGRGIWRASHETSRVIY